jgi:hypothetical protein
MNDVKTISNLTLAENSINNNDTKKNLDPEKLVNIPKKKFQSTPSLTLVKLGIRKDIFGEEIKKGVKHRISFVDYKMPSDDNIDKKTLDYKTDFAEVIDIMSYKAHTKKMSYKEVEYEEKIYCNNCYLF